MGWDRQKENVFFFCVTLMVIRTTLIKRAVYFFSRNVSNRSNLFPLRIVWCHIKRFVWLAGIGSRGSNNAVCNLTSWTFTLVIKGQSSVSDLQWFGLWEIHTGLKFPFTVCNLTWNFKYEKVVTLHCCLVVGSLGIPYFKISLSRKKN